MSDKRISEDLFNKILNVLDTAHYQYEFFEATDCLKEVDDLLEEIDRTDVDIPRVKSDTECHICECHTELTCAFDKEMNSHSNPRSCCGNHDCAGDV